MAWQSRAVTANPSRYIVLLRGINVGGHARIAMADLRAMLTDLGYDDVATVLQSGNAVLTAKASAARIASDVAKRLHAETKLAVTCVVRTVDEMRAALNRDPYEGRADDPAKYVIGFMDRTPAAAKVASLDTAFFAPDEFRIIGREAYIWCPNGLRDTKLTAPNFERKLGVTMTVRNWNTCQKVFALAQP
jgi:uncharacterized protein (DUF1697 family)